MFLLDAVTDYVQAWAAVATVTLGIVSVVIAGAGYFQGKKIKELEDLVIELKNQTTLLAEDVAINRERLSLEETINARESGPFFDNGHSRPVDVGILVVEIANQGSTANKIIAKSNDPRVVGVKVGTQPIQKGYPVQIFVTLDQHDRLNHPFSFYLQYSGQGEQWFQQEVKNKGNGTITVSERKRINRPED